MLIAGKMMKCRKTGSRCDRVSVYSLIPSCPSILSNFTSPVWGSGNRMKSKYLPNFFMPELLSKMHGLSTSVLRVALDKS